ncbi:MAG: HAD-IC family P-type ATPase [Candidatus Paceibacterota bacterium]
MAYNGERVVALVAAEVGPTSKKTAKDLAALKGLKLIGTISFKDPIKETVKDSLEEVTKAGVKTVIVTGDHTGTAVSIAKELGMLIGEDSVLSGEILETLSDEELSVRTKNLKIVSRVSPEGKMRLVQAFQANGEIVAMNGDGVNDAPAIKQADIGIAMGTGTDVAKQAADLVLLDDNFETIVEAIKEGHRIVQNMRKALIYLMSSILDEVLLIGAAILVGIPMPLSPLQILWKNFFADSFPGLALAFEHKIDKIESQPTKIKQGIFTNKMKILLFMNGTISSALLIILYILLLQFGVEEVLARTVTFAAFSSYTLFLVFSMRSLKKEIYKYNPFSNQAVNLSFLIGMALIAISIYVPFFQKLFNTVPLSGVWIIAVIAFGLLNIASVEATKKLVHERF